MQNCSLEYYFLKEIFKCNANLEHVDGSSCFLNSVLAGYPLPAGPVGWVSCPSSNVTVVSESLQWPVFSRVTARLNNGRLHLLSRVNTVLVCAFETVGVFSSTRRSVGPLQRAGLASLRSSEGTVAHFLLHFKNTKLVIPLADDLSQQCPLASFRTPKVF